jgi:superfamily II DNA or RNA helicase
MTTQPLKAILVRNGNALYLARRLDVPLPTPVYMALAKHMQYRHVTRLYGAAAYGLSPQQRIRSEWRRLFGIDDYGCLNFPAGYYDRVREILTGLGYQVRYVDDSPQFPQQLEWRWDNLGAFQFRPKQEEALRRIEAAFKERRGGVIDAAAGFGKAQPLNAMIQTPRGPTCMAALAVGDEISHPSGGTTRVVGIYPQGEKEVYRITFQDGASVECCGDHLWEVYSDRGQRRVVDTHYLIAHHRRPNGRMAFSVKLPRPLKLRVRQRRGRLISPYLLGVLLGDGGLTSNVPKVTNVDDETVAKVGTALARGFRLVPDGSCTYMMTRPKLGTPKTENLYRRELKRLGIWGLKSPEKYIPREYLHGTIADRWELLRGLMDTDGEVTRRGAVVYGTSSLRLCRDVQWLVESLGGIARVKTRPRLLGGFHYRIGIRLDDARRAFTLARKRDRVIARTKYFPKRFIASIIPVGRKPCQCIAVSADDGLYLTDHCVVTHNTELFPALAMLLPTAKILIGVKSIENVQKTVRVLLKYLPKMSVGQRGGGRSREARVTVATAASLGNYTGRPDLFLGDEAHELLAETYVGDIVTVTPQAVRYAFTATVEGRSDHADDRMEAVFGKTLFRLTYPECVALKLVVPIETRWRRIVLNSNPAADYEGDTARKRHGLWTNAARNKDIAAVARQHHEAGDQVLILVDKIEHLLHLARLLPEFTLCFGNITEADEGYYAKNKLLPPDYKPLTVAIRKQLREDFEVGKIRAAIATGVWRLGVSFDALAVMLWAGSGSSPIDATQGPSRVSRIHDASNKEHGIVYDWTDEFDEQFYKQAMARRRIYKKHEWTQVEPEGAFSQGIQRMFFS